MIDLTLEDRLAVLTLNRPDKANSLTAEMLAQMAGALDRLADDPDLRALILTGAGDKVFSAGADLEEARGGDLTTSPLWEEVSGRIAGLDVMTIAALNGTLAGGAFGVALACDMRVAVEGASFFYPVARHGFLPQPSDPGRLAALVGPARAKHLLLAGQKWSADEAHQFGLVEQIVPSGRALVAARELAETALSGRPDILRRIKQMCSA